MITRVFEFSFGFVIKDQHNKNSNKGHKRGYLHDLEEEHL